MSTSPAASVLTKSPNSSAWRREGRVPSSSPLRPADPQRQAKRLPIKALTMLTARAGHLLHHPEYLQPLPSAPISPIELDAKKSPLALLAQTCSQIGKSDPPSATKPSSGSGSSSSTGSGSSPSSVDRESKAPLKMSDLGAESCFKPYNKPDKKESGSGGSGERNFRVPSATCTPFTPRTCTPFSPRTCSPSSVTSVSPGPGDSKDKEEKKEERPDSEPRTTAEEGPKANAEVTPPAPSGSTHSATGVGLVAPVSPYKPGHMLSLPYPYSQLHGYSPPFLSPTLDAKAGGSLMGVTLDPKAGGLLGQFSLGGVKGAELCRDPYCLGFHCGASCESVKSAYPLMYAPLNSGHAPMTSSLQGHAPMASSYPGHALYYGLTAGELPGHACNWVSANGACDKRFVTSEELLAHLRTHTTDKLLPGYHSNSPSLAMAAAAAMCHVHTPGGGGGLALRGSHHALGLSRFHPYAAKPLHMAPAGHAPHTPYYSPSPYFLGPRLTPALYQ